MAGRLKSGQRKKRVWPAALILLPVLLVHGCVGHGLQTLLRSWQPLDEAPPRLSVSYVRELRPEPVAALPKPLASKPRPPVVPAQAAAALPPEAPIPAAEPQAEAASAPELAASAAEADAEASAKPAAAASAPQDLANQEPGPEWPPSTRLSYELTGNYRGAVTGQAQVAWIRQGSRYQVHLEVGVGPVFAPLLSRRMSSDGVLGPNGISPRRYDEDTKFILGELRRLSLLFQGDSLRLADGREEALAAGSQDAASQFVQLTWLFLTGREQMRPGLVLELPLVLPRRQYRWRYEVLGEELLPTPMGALATWHLRPSVVASGGDLTAEVWLAPSLQYLPVRIRIRQDEKNFVDLMLKAPPLQAEPEP
ncbi:hypothetical protein HNP55_004751 [Paucibacter oligotrophus]|uniref:DUF3108 domain-containing protein n=1 Tax=Roseateles oligotrophus TaxID=1769250 RepID=A0A840LLL1_9BURK|nr:DUF3108 domain-containing protein [Roseateles oligotrophus]MBB4846197.1 hypothetical protein [Roseateles oligotrophus]